MEGWNGQKAFTFWASFADNEDILTEKEEKELYYAIVRYVFFDEDREEKLTKTARASFRHIKSSLKASKANSKNGSIPKAKQIENETETKSERNAIEKATNTKSNTKSKSKSNAKRERVHAACPKCGGTLEPTGATINVPNGKRRIYVCSCGEEVQYDE